MNYPSALKKHLKYVPDYLWIIMTFLFSMSLFVSKSGMSIFGFLLLIMALPKTNISSLLKDYPYVPILMSFYPLGFFLNLFSVGGLQSSLLFLSGWPWPLLALPCLHIFLSQRRKQSFILGASIGLTLACLNSLSKFTTAYQLQSTPLPRVDSFWMLGTWGTFCAVAIVTLIGYIYKNSFSENSLPKKATVGVLAVLSILSILAAGTRGPWLGVAVGLIFLFACNVKKWRLSLLFCTPMLVAMLIPSIHERIYSIFDVARDHGEIVSSNTSNLGRLNMWHVAIDLWKEHPFFGVGFESTEGPIRSLITTKGPEYAEKYTTINFSYRDQHSSYFSSLAQLGIIFFVTYWSFHFYLFFMSIRNKHFDNGLSASLIACLSLIFVFYSNLFSFEGALLSIVVAYFSVASKSNNSEL